MQGEASRATGDEGAYRIRRARIEKAMDEDDDGKEYKRKNEERMKNKKDKEKEKHDKEMEKEKAKREEEDRRGDQEAEHLFEDFDDDMPEVEDRGAARRRSDRDKDEDEEERMGKRSRVEEIAAPAEGENSGNTDGGGDAAGNSISARLPQSEDADGDAEMGELRRSTQQQKQQPHGQAEELGVKPQNQQPHGQAEELEGVGKQPGMVATDNLRAIMAVDVAEIYSPPRVTLEAKNMRRT